MVVNSVPWQIIWEALKIAGVVLKVVQLILLLQK